MNKVYYKNEEFFYEIYKNHTFNSWGSWVRVYKKREGFWKIFSPHKLILKREFGKCYFKSNEDILKYYLKDIREGLPPIFIDCSEKLVEVLKL